MTGKRAYLTLHENLWIIRKKADHENRKHTQLAVAFEAHFERPISRPCTTQIQRCLHNKIHGRSWSKAHLKLHNDIESV